MSEPETKLAHVGNVFTKVMIFKNKGDTEIGHAHLYDHCTLVASGAVRIRARGKETDFIAPHVIWIEKGVLHELEALEDNTVCACIHALRDEEGTILDPSMLPNGAPLIRFGLSEGIQRLADPPKA